MCAKIKHTNQPATTIASSSVASIFRLVEWKNSAAWTKMKSLPLFELQQCLLIKKMPKFGIVAIPKLFGAK